MVAILFRPQELYTCTYFILPLQLTPAQRVETTSADNGWTFVSPDAPDAPQMDTQPEPPQSPPQSSSSGAAENQTPSPQPSSGGAPVNQASSGPLYPPVPKEPEPLHKGKREVHLIRILVPPEYSSFITSSSTLFYWLHIQEARHKYWYMHLSPVWMSKCLYRLAVHMNMSSICSLSIFSKTFVHLV